MSSKYREMWLIVMFDLPVIHNSEKKKARDFRDKLLKQGFRMMQYSVYYRFCGSVARTERFIKRVEEEIPNIGKVHIFQFTDKQFGMSKMIINREKSNTDEFNQLLLL